MKKSLFFCLLAAATVLRPAPESPHARPSGAGSFWIETLGGDVRKRMNYAPTLISADGGYAVAGFSDAFGGRSLDFLAVFLDADGRVVWSRNLGGPRDDKAYSIQRASDGGFFITGFSELSADPDSSDLLVVKLDAGGVPVWCRSLDSGTRDVSFSARACPDGGLALCGGTEIGGTTAGDDVLLVRMDRDGNLVWAKTYGDKKNEHAEGIEASGDGGFVLGGLTHSGAQDQQDGLVMKVDASGRLEWARAVGGNQLECGNWDGIRVSEDGGILFGGKTLTYGAGEYDLFLFKLTQNGDLVWSRAAGSPGDDACWTLTPTRDGGCIAGGKLHDASDVESAQAADAVLMKLDAAGGLEWTSVVGDSLFQEIEEIIETTGGYAIAGTHSFGSGQGDFLVAATDATGRVPGCGWSRTAEPAFSSIEPRCAETAMTVQDVTDRIRVSDFIAESSIPNLRADIPCASGTSVRSGGKRSPGPSTFFFEPVFPNPFNPAARIHYRLEKTSRVRLDVMDIRGRRVAVLRDGTEQPGPHTALFTAEGAVSGTFLFRLNVDGKVSVQKAVLSR